MDYPSPRYSPDQNTGVGSRSLLQGIFPTQESNPGLLHCRRILYQLSHRGRWIVTGGEGILGVEAQHTRCWSTYRSVYKIDNRQGRTAQHKNYMQGFKHPLEKEMATHSRLLVWKIPWTEEPGRLQPMELQRVGHDWATSLSFFL